MKYRIFFIHLYYITIFYIYLLFIISVRVSRRYYILSIKSILLAHKAFRVPDARDRVYCT